MAGLSMRIVGRHLNGGGLAARVLRGSMVTLIGFGGGQALRLLSNLILTRLLVPEAFGLMMLVTVLVIGLKMFSDIGIAQSILRSPRGDEQLFLDTAWSLDLIRGALLWGLACLLARPMAEFYDIPQLAQLLPVTALVLLIGGFEPTRVDTAARHMELGRITAFELASQACGILVMIGLAALTGSVWALVAGQIVASLIRLGLMVRGLPGQGNRFRIDPTALRELLGFGIWIFVSTVAGYLVAQGDKLVLSKFLTLEMLGIYNIGYFLAAVPGMLGGALVGRLMIPLYRERPPSASAANFAALRRFRFLLSGSLVGLGLFLAVIGVWLVGLLYDPRYAAAGPVLVLLSLAFLPQLIVQSYDQIALTVGASRMFCLVSVARGALMLACVGAGAAWLGLKGAVLGQALAYLLSYPIVAWLAWRYGAWDPVHDAIMGLLSIVGAGFALWLHAATIAALP